MVLSCMPAQVHAADVGLSQEEMRRDCLRNLKSAAAVLAAAVGAVTAAAEQAPGRRLPDDLASACGTSVKALLGALAARPCQCCRDFRQQKWRDVVTVASLQKMLHQHSNPFVTAKHFGVDCSCA
jgi:hypothetical protein